MPYFLEEGCLPWGGCYPSISHEISLDGDKSLQKKVYSSNVFLILYTNFTGKVEPFTLKEFLVDVPLYFLLNNLIPPRILQNRLQLYCSNLFQWGSLGGKMHILRWEVIWKHTTWHSPGTLLCLPVIAPRLQTKVSFFLGGRGSWDLSQSL